MDTNEKPDFIRVHLWLKTSLAQVGKNKPADARRITSAGSGPQKTRFSLRSRSMGGEEPSTRYDALATGKVAQHQEFPAIPTPRSETYWHVPQQYVL